MPSTYLSLTNQVLRRMNEVEIAPSDFGNARGVQALAKDSVRNTIAKINQTEFEWPFNAAEHTQQLTPGQTEYSYPTFHKVTDFNTFQIQKDSSLSVDFKTLRFVERDVWYKNHRDLDYGAGSAGRDVPDLVFPSHGNGFGVSPSPDKPYSVRFRYFLNGAALVLADDEVRIPETYDATIVEGALYYMYMFRDNAESAGIAASLFDQGVKEMRTLLINKYERITDTRVRF